MLVITNVPRKNAPIKPINEAIDFLKNAQYKYDNACALGGTDSFIIVRFRTPRIYDIETNKYSFVDLENDQPFMHFKITDFSDIENEREELLNLG